MPAVVKVGGLSVVLPAYRVVSLTNILTNGNFASTSGWGHNGASFSVASNEASFLANGANDFVYRNDVSIIDTNIYYFCGWIKSSSASVRCVMSVPGVRDVAENHTGSGNYEFISDLYPSISTTANAVMYPLNDLRASGWDTLYAKYFSIINLTAAFGAGNEPSKAQMDWLMQQYTDRWLNGTQNANYYW
jgi:hypothetical protein